MTDPILDLTTELREFAGEVNARLTEIINDLRGHAGWISEAGPHILSLPEDLKALRTAQAVHAEQITLLLQEMPRQPTHPPVCWHTLTADEADTLWDELGDWVADVLVGVYRANRENVPDCWPLHQIAVEALTWLRTSWLHAHMATATPNALAEWHTRWKREAFKEITEGLENDAEALREHGCEIRSDSSVHFGEELPTDPGLPADEASRKPELRLADRGFWQPQLLKAKREDVARRRATEAAAAPPPPAP